MVMSFLAKFLIIVMLLHSFLKKQVMTPREAPKEISFVIFSPPNAKRSTIKAFSEINLVLLIQQVLSK